MYPLLERPGLAALDPLAELEYAIDELAEVDHREVSGHERRTRLMCLQRLQNRVDAERLRLVEVVDRSGDALAFGAVNTKAWLHHECNVAKGAAGSDVRAARRLEEFPAWTKAYAAGSVTRGHVDVLAKAATSERVGQLAEHQALLLEQAKQFAPDTFARIVSRACEVIDADKGPNEARDQIERRRLHLSPTLDGMGKLDGIFDPESTLTLEAALEHFMALDPDTGDEKRPMAQRRADAAVSMARYALATSEPDTTKSRHGRPTAIMCTDLHRLAADKHDLIDAIRNEVREAGRLSSEALLRLTCDANISRVLTVGKSEILDVGRITRAIPPALWRALVARDGGCQHKDGCDAPLWACEAHHIVHWAHGGPTNLANLILICWRHHRNEHEGKGHDPPRE